MRRKAVSGIMLMLLLIGTLGLSSSKGEGGTQTDKISDVGPLSTSTAFSEGFEGVFPADNWLVQDESSNNGLDYWDDTNYRSHVGSWSGWCAQIGSQTSTPETILGENFEGAFPGSWTVEDFDSGSGNDIWDDTSYRSYEGSWSAWCAEIGTKAGAAVTIFYEGFEGAWPGAWTVYDSNATNGYDYWGDYSGKSYVGSWSGYCADEGSHPVGCGYDDYMDAYMYRSVSLSGYSSVTLSYYYWLSCEYNYDYLDVIYFDSSWHYIDQHTGNISAWQYSFVSIPTSAVYVGLHFHSDVSICYFAGAFIDQVQLTGIPQVPNNSVHEYDNDMEAYMYHPVSLSGYSSVSLSYQYWLSSENNYDYLYVTYFDGSWHDIDPHTNSSGGWQSSSVSIPTSAIYVGFHFSSDYSYCNYEGAYVDQVVLRGVYDVPNASLHLYDDYMDASMVRKYTIDASAWASATLYYWAWYQTDPPSSDYCQVIVTDDGGAHWYYIGERLTGISGWSYHTLSIPDTYLTSLFNIGFMFHSDSGARYEGVYLDDIVMEYAPSPIYIRADGSVDPPTSPILRNGDLYTFTDDIYTGATYGIVIERNNIILDGAGHKLQGTGDNTGINLQGRSGVTLKNMEIRAFDYGILLFSSTNNIIYKNIITANTGLGIFLDSSSNSNIISANSITATPNYGIWLYSSNNAISANNITNNWLGIVLYSSSNNTISGNSITANNYDGIDLYSSSYNNIISNNDIIANNARGIYFDSSSNNGIYHNNFVNNTNQVSNYNSVNVWDEGYPSGGNHWSDYTGLDLFKGPYQNETGSDGIGDTSHVIDVNNRDNYPLMGAWTPHSTQYPWAMFHHDLTHTAYSDSPTSRTSQKRWNYTTGSNVLSSPAVADGKVYVGSFDGKVYCLNALNGTYVWSYLTGGPVESSPAVSDLRVYVGSYDNKLYCLDALTGAYKWSYTTNNDVRSSPAVFDGKVYVGSLDGKVYCLNASTGAYIWSYTTGHNSKHFVRSSPAVAYGKVYVGSFDFELYCLDASTGGFVWSYTTTSGFVFSSPAIADGKVYVGSNNNIVYCLDALTGGDIWSYSTSGPATSSPAVADGVVFIGSSDKNVYAFGNIIKVPEDYPTVQEAVNAAPVNATILVAPGVYHEYVTINKTLTILGEKGTESTFTGGGTGTAFNIKPGADGTNIAQVTISKYAYGVAIDNSAQCRIFDNIMYSMTDSGIAVKGSIAVDTLIYNNIFQNNPIAVNLTQSSTSNTICGNTISYNNIGLLLKSGGNTIYANTISQNNYGIRLLSSNNNVIYWNNFADNIFQQVDIQSSISFWDKGYPMGGNYWGSSYAPPGTDLHSGPNRDKPGRDGLGDTPYVIYGSNQDNYPLMKPFGGSHDIGIMEVTCLRTIVGQGYEVKIEVTILSYGIYTETRNIKIYAGTMIAASKDTELKLRNSTTITFTWNTNGFLKGNYIIKAYATPITDDVDINDNNHQDGTVLVTIAGDVNGDRIVNVFDLYLVGRSYGATDGSPSWDPNFNINNDLVINKSDLEIISQNLGQSF